MRVWRRHDFDHVSIAKLIFERNDSAVCFCSAAGEPYLSVDEEREIDRSRAARQLDDFSFRREAVDLLRIEVELERIEKLSRVFYFLLPLDEPLQPDERFVLIGMSAATALFVLPVGGDAFLSDRVHLRGSNLHFERLTAVAYA